MTDRVGSSLFFLQAVLLMLVTLAVVAQVSAAPQRYRPLRTLESILKSNSFLTKHWVSVAPETD